MLPIRLPKAQGFPYRFGQPQGCSPFLQHLEDDLLGSSERNHRSTITLKLIREDILRFSNTAKDLTNDALFQLAIHKVCDDFRLPSTVPLIHINDIFSKYLVKSFLYGSPVQVYRSDKWNSEPKVKFVTISTSEITFASYVIKSRQV